VSTNSECLFFKWSTGWFYLLEDYHAPKNAWDWREHAQAWGPFDTRDKAYEHLGRCHANPGGSSTDETPDLTNTVLQQAVREART
jgi:hypothetical protein